MADTLSLDTAVDFVVGRGGSVRLIGDDQQLAAIGAGGVLRDIASHPRRGPAHRAASGSPTRPKPPPPSPSATADPRRSGSTSTTTGSTSATSPPSPRTSSPPGRPTAPHGLDAIMLAPTRELVAELNQRARDRPPRRHRRPAARCELADGNQASVGDLIITRSNDRRLRTHRDRLGQERRPLDRPRRHATTAVLTVQHTTQPAAPSPCPPTTSPSHVELGYATTVHAAQGVTADTMHGLATGEESRQQLYTMLTRGRTANHLYLQVVGDGDPHTVIRPDNVRPPTATDLLEQILARDDAPQLRHHPAARAARPRRPARRTPPPATSTPSTSPPNTSPSQTVVANLDRSADRLLRA